ncbi:hypothetical protein BGZ46_005913, partial [Entomortierella lignicola]
VKSNRNSIKMNKDLHYSNLGMDKVNSKSLESDASDSEGSNDFIEKRAGMNSAHGELISIRQDTDDSSIASQEDSINCDSVSIITTAKNRNVENESRSVVRSGSLLPVEMAARLLRSEQLVGDNIENESVCEDSSNMSTEVKSNGNDGDS